MKYLLITVLAFSFLTGLCHSNFAYAHSSESSIHSINMADQECPQCNDIEDETQSINCCSTGTIFSANLAYFKNEPTLQKSSKQHFVYQLGIKDSVANTFKKDNKSSPVLNGKNSLSYNFVAATTLKLE